MNDSNPTRCALAGCAAAILLAACGGVQPPVAAQRSSRAERARPLGAYESLYSFQGDPDGQNPQARLTPLKGDLYGTTSAGGEKCGGRGCGTVFKITPAGAETVLHRFAGGSDGADPLSELTPVKNTLYGTTYTGGAHCVHRRFNPGCGVVFALSTSGNERVLHRFTGIPDGAEPQGPLTPAGGKLYGTTTAGGAKCIEERGGCGTVYSIDASGKERVLYRFAGQPDGANPTGNLVYLNGKLYGTTTYGGAYRWGTVFQITLSGRERAIYSSGGAGGDMSEPSGLVAMGGVLYGSSPYGGRHSGGTVYVVTTRGAETVLHNFNQNLGLNGDRPYGRLIAVNGLLYGTTLYGGERYGDYGIVYSLSPAGTFRVLYRFKGPPDGAAPYAGVTDANGVLYGTTDEGGTGCYHYGCQGGYGTAFRILR